MELLLHYVHNNNLARVFQRLFTINFSVHVILGYPEDRPLTFVLNSDGTEVDEEYAEAVEMHSILIALKDGDRWTDHKKGNEDNTNKRKGRNNYVYTTCLDSEKCSHSMVK